MVGAGRAFSLFYSKPDWVYPDQALVVYIFEYRRVQKPTKRISNQGVNRGKDLGRGSLQAQGKPLGGSRG